MLEVIARDVLTQRAAKLHEVAGRYDDLEPGHPLPRDAVLERVRPTGVRGDVAADLRLLGGAWIGSKQQAALACDPSQFPGAKSRFDLDAPDERVERTHVVETFERENDSTVERHRSPGVPCPAAARHDGDAVRVTPRDDFGDFLCCPWKRDGICATDESACLGHVRQVGGGRCDDVRGDRRAQLPLDGRDCAHDSARSSSARPSCSTGSPCDTSTISTGRSSSGRSPARRSSCV